MATSHKRLEEMMQSFFYNVGSKEDIAGNDMQIQASSVKFVDTSVFM